MSKFSNFNPETSTSIFDSGDYSLNTHITGTGQKYILVKNGKVLSYMDTSLTKPSDPFCKILGYMIKSFEYNAKRDLELLRASIAKKQRFIEEILEVYGEGNV